MKKIILLLLIILSLLCGCAVQRPASPSAMNEGDVRILFINVGKADAALLSAGDRHYLIDTGTKDSAEDLLAALETVNVEALDGVFLTHTHSDHIGGMETLAENIPIATLYHADITELTKKGVNKFERFSEELDIPHEELTAGDVLTLAEGVTAEVLGPLEPNEEDDNDQSLVLRVSANGRRVLFTGDMQFAEERSLMSAGVDLAADVLKVGNHGNPDATLESFAEAVSPSVAVISTDTAEDEDSANRRVLDALGGDTAVFITEDASLGILVTIASDGIITTEAVD